MGQGSLVLAKTTPDYRGSPMPFDICLLIGEMVDSPDLYSYSLVSKNHYRAAEMAIPRRLGAPLTGDPFFEIRLFDNPDNLELTQKKLLLDHYNQQSCKRYALLSQGLSCFIGVPYPQNKIFNGQVSIQKKLHCRVLFEKSPSVSQKWEVFYTHNDQPMLMDLETGMKIKLAKECTAHMVSEDQVMVQHPSERIRCKLYRLQPGSKGLCRLKAVRTKRNNGKLLCLDQTGCLRRFHSMTGQRGWKVWDCETGGIQRESDKQGIISEDRRFIIEWDHRELNVIDTVTLTERCNFHLPFIVKQVRPHPSGDSVAMLASIDQKSTWMILDLRSGLWSIAYQHIREGPVNWEWIHPRLYIVSAPMNGIRAEVRLRSVEDHTNDLCSRIVSRVVNIGDEPPFQESSVIPGSEILDWLDTRMVKSNLLWTADSLIQLEWLTDESNE